MSYEDAIRLIELKKDERIRELEVEIERLRKGLLRIENGDACDGCKTDNGRIRFYDDDGEYVHSCRKAIATATLLEEK
jgi:hypothetical protein